MNSPRDFEVDDFQNVGDGGSLDRRNGLFGTHELRTREGFHKVIDMGGGRYRIDHWRVECRYLRDLPLPTPPKP